jgi:hypothetical protein
MGSLITGAARALGADDTAADALTEKGDQLLQNVYDSRPGLGSINAGPPLKDRLTPGTVMGIVLLLGRLLRKFCFLDLFCETDPVVGIKVIAEPALYGIKAEAGAL